MYLKSWPNLLDNIQQLAVVIGPAHLRGEKILQDFCPLGPDRLAWVRSRGFGAVGVRVSGLGCYKLLG